MLNECYNNQAIALPFRHRHRALMFLFLSTTMTPCLLQPILIHTLSLNIYSALKPRLIRDWFYARAVLFLEALSSSLSPCLCFLSTLCFSLPLYSPHHIIVAHACRHCLTNPKVFEGRVSDFFMSVPPAPSTVPSIESVLNKLLINKSKILFS